MHERLKEIRKIEGLTQTEFAKKIGLKQSALGMMESGTNNINDRHIKAICSIFNVNEHWFRTGEGEMFIDEEDTESSIDKLAKEYNLGLYAKKILETYLKLDEKGRSTIENYLEDFVKSVQAEEAQKQDEPKEEDETVKVFRAAYSDNNDPPAFVDMPKSVIDRIRNAPESDDDF